MNYWPTRFPGMPYVWFTDLATLTPADRCPMHDRATDAHGVCAYCVVKVRKTAGVLDPYSAPLCSGCPRPMPLGVAGGSCLICTAAADDEEVSHAN